MAFDINMIRDFYQTYPQKVAKARELLGHPLTLSEKILRSLVGFTVQSSF